MLTLITTTLAAWLPGVAILKWLKVGSYIAVLVVGGWGAVRAQNWWHGDKLTEKQAQARCDFTMANAAARARLAAVLQREQAVLRREASVEADELQIASEIERMREARNASAKQGTGGVALGPDDEWLRAWRARTLDRTRHR